MNPGGRRVDIAGLVGLVILIAIAAWLVFGNATMTWLPDPSSLRVVEWM
ncbi:MAG: hypothetical protein U0768_01495 [Anaerolineae bacterium]